MAVKPLPDEHNLLAKIAGGDQNAFTIFYYYYNKPVYLFAYRILESEELAEEMMQEVMLKIWMLGDELTKIKNIESYLRVMSKNRCLNQLRKLRLQAGKNQPLDETPEPCTNETEETILLNDTKKVLEKAISNLPPQQREVYTLCQVQGMKYEDAACKMNISVLTVQSYMKLALRSLRKTMKNHTGIAAIITILKLM
jgi:RNA polymerase sigma-70 factor (family 1)